MGVYMQFAAGQSSIVKGLTVALALTFAGCAVGPLTPRESTTLGGAALGAGAGALIGSTTHAGPGAGAAIGGAVGGLGGALVGGGMQSQDARLAARRHDLEQRQYELERQQYELDRQRYELEDRRWSADDYYYRHYYYD